MLSFIFHSLIMFVIYIKKNKNKFSIGTWADKFGDELWDLAQKMTKANEIKTVSLTPHELIMITKIDYLITIIEIQIIECTC